jgi:hypothetical protein
MAKPKKKKVVPMRIRMRRAAKAAHKAMSLYIRAAFIAEYGMCPLCGKEPVQALFHILRSKYVKILRYDIRNAIGSCHKCNWKEYRNPDPSRAWYIRKYGVEQYLKLVDEGQNNYDYTLEDYDRIATNYTQLLKNLEPKPIATDSDASSR